MRAQSIFVVVLIAIAAAFPIACARRSATAPQQHAATPPPAGPVIVRLVGRNQTVTVTKGPAGPLYSVADADGRVVLEPLALEQIAARDPELHRYIQSALASDASDSRR